MRKVVRFGLFAVIAAIAASTLAAKDGAFGQYPSVGERGVAMADAPVPHPPGRSCVVALYSNVRFGPHGNPTAMSAHPHTWSYSPPKDCAGPWSAVLLEADFRVARGRQYDRTASLWLDGVNLFYGTTQEPQANVSPHWRIERNLTDYASLFRRAGNGQVILNNWVNAVDNSVITGSARLVFYPATRRGSRIAPASRVYGLDGNTGGMPINVQSTHDALSRTFTFPRNIERAYLDVIAQSQATDEQWYMCVDDVDLIPTREYSLGPPASGDPLEQCGNTSFREVEVSIDGEPAGRAPIYPWTYTGGVDPYLWRPTPDVQTLNFVPYRIDLTPFAGVLDNGRPHTVSVRVLKAHNFFSLAANLLVYLDVGRKTLSGRVTENTLATDRARFVPYVHRWWRKNSHGNSNGQVNTTQQGDYTIAGVLSTSHGVVRTQVEQQSIFSNRQKFLHPEEKLYHQIIQQETQVTDTTTTSAHGVISMYVSHLSYPLLVDITKQMKPDGGFTAVITMRQAYKKGLHDTRASHIVSWSRLSNERDTHDAVDFNATGTALSNSHDQHGNQNYAFRDSAGNCYARSVDTRGGAVTAVTSGRGCPGNVNRLRWPVWPNAM